MSTILEMQIDELQEELDAIKAINQKLQLEKNTLKEQLILHGVTHRRELLIAYEKNHYTPIEWAQVSEQCIEDIDNFLAINCA